ncbi:MAG: UDP-3-O-acyl-N-acetylglucosamine deacetylase [Pseudomonadota bacterium]
MRQSTISRAVHAIGVGVHSGQKVSVTLRPAEVDSGIMFQRRDLPGGPLIHANMRNVSDTCLATTIGAGEAAIGTVEHLMSALWGLGIDNLLVELGGSEVPIMDGSAAPFVDLIQSAGIVAQDAPREFLRLLRPIEVSQGDATARLDPYDGFRVRYTFVADHPVYNRYPKSIDLELGPHNYAEQLGGARSFGLVRELNQAQSINRCLGSSLDNAIGIDDESILNEEGLRYPDEFVKHKALDVIGDLYLLGRPILGCFTGYMSGHALNNKLLRALERCDDAWDVVELDERGLPYRSGSAADSQPTAEHKI